MFENSNHLGYPSPYFYNNNGKIKVFNNFQNTVLSRNGENYIDPISIIELVNKGYILGNRTMLQNIERAPWMAKLNKDQDQWNYHNLPKHDELNLTEEEVSTVLYDKLYQELHSYINGSANIGILLSGGMDSRIVGGIIANIIKNEKLAINVIGLTWGKSDCRDVVYAKEICRILNWEWKHFTANEEDLIQNIKITAERGAEYSPIHLHAMNKIANIKGLDCIIAGSYGDSIGRGEYSGKHVLNLKSLLTNMRNDSSYFNAGLVSKNFPAIKNDILEYHRIFPQKYKYMMLENDYQLHYMRRMLNTCMSVINEKIPFHQAYTSPDVFGYIWSINPRIRTNRLYYNIINEKLSTLKHIPWARTGKIYLDDQGKADNFLKGHHSYAKDFYSETLLNELKPLILSDEIYSLGVFNMDVIKSTLKTLIKHPIYNKMWYQSFYYWLSSLSVMVNIYNIKPNSLTTHHSFISNTTNKFNYYCSAPSEFLLKKIYSKL